jgi:sortase A
VPRAGPAAAAAALPNRRSATAARALALLLAAAGLAFAARGLWIPAKAVLAQGLLAAAWERAAAGEARPRPWPWADTWPVARLTLPGRAPLVVLAGASGRTLAFGPGHVDGSAAPGEAGNVVVAGHRDTHFRALAGLAAGDELVLEAPGGAARRYRVRETAVVDHRDTRPLLPSASPRLTLVTCWPFDAVRPGGPLRWVVVAEAADGAASAAPPAGLTGR